MNGQRITAFLLIVIGVLVLIYGGFSYNKDTHKENISSLHLPLEQKRFVKTPLWAGIGILVMGGMLLPGKKV